MSLDWCNGRKWRAEQSASLSTPMLVDWMANAVREAPLDMRSPEDWDRLLLSVKPSPMSHKVLLDCGIR